LGSEGWAPEKYILATRSDEGIGKEK